MAQILALTISQVCQKILTGKPLNNPLSKTWTTAYADLGGGGSRTTLTDPNGINTQRDFDRAGNRLFQPRHSGRARRGD